MRRALAVCIAVLLVVAVLAPGALADRSGRGGGEGNGNGSGQAAPAANPGGDREHGRDHSQDRDRDCDDCDQAPIPDRERDGQDVTADTPRVTDEDTKGPQGNGKGPDRDKPDNGKGPGDKPDHGKGLGDKPGNGWGPENAPGQAVSAEVRSRHTDEDEDTENTHRIRVELQVEDPEVQDAGDEALDDDGDDEIDEPANWAHRVWAWQRALMNSTKHAVKLKDGKPFMMVGQPTIGVDGSLAIDLWKGNRLARDYYRASESPTPISVTLVSEIRLIDDGVVTQCDPADAETCLAEWLEANAESSAYLSVWGRVEMIDGEEVFVAHRITVTVPRMGGVTPTKTATVGPTVPAPTATPTEQQTIVAPTPTVTSTPTKELTIDAPTATPTP